LRKSYHRFFSLDFRRLILFIEFNVIMTVTGWSKPNLAARSEQPN